MTIYNKIWPVVFYWSFRNSSPNNKTQRSCKYVPEAKHVIWPKEKFKRSINAGCENKNLTILQENWSGNFSHASPPDICYNHHQLNQILLPECATFSNITSPQWDVWQLTVISNILRNKNQQKQTIYTMNKASQGHINCPVWSQKH